MKTDFCKINAIQTELAARKYELEGRIRQIERDKVHQTTNFYQEFIRKKVRVKFSDNVLLVCYFEGIEIGENGKFMPVLFTAKDDGSEGLHKLALSEMHYNYLEDLKSIELC